MNDASFVGTMQEKYYNLNTACGLCPWNICLIFFHQYEVVHVSAIVDSYFELLQTGVIKYCHLVDTVYYFQQILSQSFCTRIFPQLVNHQFHTGFQVACPLPSGPFVLLSLTRALKPEHVEEHYVQIQLTTNSCRTLRMLCCTDWECDGMGQHLFEEQMRLLITGRKWL